MTNENSSKALADELLPCPFCGVGPYSQVVYGRGEDEPHAFCFECPNGCSVSKEKPTYEEAIKTWNTRSPSRYRAAPADGWQPIETAPKQGCIEAKNINGDLFCVWWNDAAFKGFPIRGGVFCVPHLAHWRHAPEAESQT